MNWSNSLQHDDREAFSVTSKWKKKKATLLNINFKHKKIPLGLKLQGALTFAGCQIVSREKSQAGCANIELLEGGLPVGERIRSRFKQDNER